MDLTMAFTRVAVQRPHVLIVEVPGWSLTRIATEQELSRRGWVQSNSPAESDILLTCGIPGTELTEVIIMSFAGGMTVLLLWTVAW